MSGPGQQLGEPAPSRAEHPHSRFSRRRLTLLAVCLAVGSVVVVVVAILLLPSAHTFSLSIAVNSGQDGRQSTTFPNGSAVSGTWSSSNPKAELEVSITTVLSGNVSALVYESPYGSSSGSFSFHALGTTYDFLVESNSGATTVQFRGSY